MLPIVSEGRWEEECVAPNSGGSSLIRCLQYSRGPDFVQCNMGMDDMRPLHAQSEKLFRPVAIKSAMDFFMSR